MSWASFFAAVLSILSKVLEAIQVNQAKQAGIDAQVQAQQAQVIDDVEKVRKAQNDYDAAVNADPDELRDEKYLRD